MIKRVGQNVNEGDIIEFNGQSMPLYIYHHGTLEVITPQEYSVCVTNLPEQRYAAITKLRLGLSE